MFIFINRFCFVFFKGCVYVAATTITVVIFVRSNLVRSLYPMLSLLHFKTTRLWKLKCQESKGSLWMFLQSFVLGKRNTHLSHIRKNIFKNPGIQLELQYCL